MTQALPLTFTGLKDLPSDAIVLAISNRIAVLSDLDSAIYDRTTGEQRSFAELDDEIIYSRADTAMFDVLEEAYSKLQGYKLS